MAARPHDADDPRTNDPEGHRPEGHEPADPAPDVISGADATAMSRAASDPDTPGGSEASPTEDADDTEDLDTRWQQIIAQLEDLGTGPAGSRPTDPTRSGYPEHDARTDDGAQRDVAAPSQPARVVRPAGPTGPRAWSPDPETEEAEDHFEPPEPEPVLSGDPLLTMAWAGVLGAPLLLLVAVLLWRDIPSIALGVAAAAFLAGLGLLLWRMPHDRDDDAGPGAVV